MKHLFLASRRAYSSSSLPKAVKLAYEKYSPKAASTTPSIDNKQKAPLIVAAGLFGSKQNWASLCRAASQRLQRDIYAVDLRNHGDSPHNKEHTFPAMAQDLLAFMEEHGLEQPILVGHSMGGKAAMMTALLAPEKVGKLISVDMPPLPMSLSKGFANYIRGMQHVDEAKCTKQSQADAILQQYESNPGIRMFLLTNLKRKTDGGILSFRLPLSILADSLSDIGDFTLPSDAQQHVYSRPTLFIAGGKSPYYPPFLKQAAQIKSYFPRNEIQVVQDAGHWVHAEKPDQVLQLVTSFCQED